MFGARGRDPPRYANDPYDPRNQTSGSPSGSASMCVIAPMPIVWSPAGCIASRSHASQASAPSSTGTPCASMWVAASNFSRATRLEANTRATSSWPARSTLTQKRRASRTAGSVRDVLSKQTSSSSGSSDTDVTAFVVRPVGPSRPLQATIATPVAKWPMTWPRRSVSTAALDTACEGYSRSPVGPQGEERDDDRGERHHAQLAAEDREHDGALPRLVEAPDRLGVVQVARVEDRLRRRGPELLGDEAGRDGKQRVQPEQPVGGVEPRHGRDAGDGGERDGGRLARPRERPEGARRRHRPPPPRAEQPRREVDGGGQQRRRGGYVSHQSRRLPLSITPSQMVVEPRANAPVVPAGDRLPGPRSSCRRGLHHPQHALRAEALRAHPRDPGRPLRVRPALGDPTGLPLRDKLLPDRDAVHPVRHRGRVPLPGGDPASGVWNLRPGGDGGLHRAAACSPRVRLAQRSPRMEIVRREKAPDDFRVRQLRARDMLRGDLEGDQLEEYVRERLITTTLDKAVSWARGNSIFPLTFGLACCAIEMMTMIGSRMDIGRFGFEAFRASPRQADMIILSGRISIKMAPVIRRIYDQMLEPKYSLAMGACSSSMGVFNNYAIVPADKFMPVDIHIPGCPPRPEALVHGILKLRSKVMLDPSLGWRERYNAEGTEELVPESVEHPAAVNVFPTGDTSGA